MISVKNLTKFYGKKRVFENFNIDFEEDKIIFFERNKSSFK